MEENQASTNTTSPSPSAAIDERESCSDGIEMGHIYEESTASASADASPSMIPRQSLVMRFWRQSILLLKKNFFMQTRSRLALIAQLFIGVLMLLVLRGMQNAIESNPFFALDFNVLREPEQRTVPYPEKCYAHAWFPNDEKKPQCYSFIVSPDANTDLSVFARKVALEMADEAGFNAEGEDRGFYVLKDEETVDTWLYENQNATPVAVIFRSDGTESSEKVSYTLQYNHTRICNVINVLDCTDPKQDLMAAFQRLVDQSVLRVSSGQSDASIDIEFSDFPHPPGEVSWDVMADYGPDWIYIALVFNMVIQMTFIVTEKENKLRDAMTQMGMTRSAYWMSWFISCEIVNVFVVLSMCAFGWAIDMDFFRENGFDVFFLHFFLAMTSFTLLAFFFSTLLSTSEQAQNFGIVWFIVTIIACPILVRIYFGNGADNKVDLIWGLSLISPTAFFKGVDDLIAASSGGRNKGMLWKQDKKPTATSPDIDYAIEGWSGNEAWYTVSDTYRSLGWCCLLYTFLCWYFDHVVPNQHGLARSPLFFLNWRYWANVRSSTSSKATFDVKEDDQVPESDMETDILAERKAVISQNFGERKPAIVVTRLQKIFVSRHYEWLYSSSWAGAFFYASLVGALFSLIAQDPGPYFFVTLLGMIILRFKCFCGVLSFRLRILPTRKFTKFTAVKGVSYAIEEDSLFVLLGHNGAGKSTTFNMMTGLMPLNGGDISIFGMSVRHDMDKISAIMGYCPQHDVLWDQLSGREHLELFARLKNIPENEIQGEVEARLKDVKLEKAADVLSGKYSGGMQRRLSLAIALIGNPKVVFLDEPTTGMDPVTRRSVWDCINRFKKGRVIVLTTHSMEEADILGDKVAIMSAGQLQALGTSLHLKNKYGGGFRLSLLASKVDMSDKIKKFVLESIASQFVSETQGVMLFRLENSNEKSVLIDFFAKLESMKEKLGILDVSIGNATLDDVFINLALQEENDDEKKIEAKFKKTYRQAGPQALSSDSTPEDTNTSRSEPLSEEAKEDCTPGKCLFKEPRHCCDWGCGKCCGDCCTCCISQAKKPAASTSNALSKLSCTGRKGPQSQVYALIRKTASFQLRQKYTMAGISCCSSIFVILIALLGALVFDPMTENSLSKWNWSCIQDELKHGEHEAPSINVGHISDKNPAYKDDDWPPLYGQESASYQFFVGGTASREAIGTLTAGNADWRKGRELLAVSDARYACQLQYDYAFEEGNTYKDDKLDKKDPESMYYADLWVSRNWTKSDLTYKSFSCKVNKYQKNITTSLDERPSNGTLWQYKKLQHSLRNCQADSSANPIEYFTDATYRTEQMEQYNGFEGSGLLGNFEFDTADRRFFDIYHTIIETAYAIMPEQIYCASKDEACDLTHCEKNWFGVGNSDTCSWVPSAIADGTLSGFYDNMASYLCNLRSSALPSAATSAEYALQTALTEIQGTANANTVDAFCRWVDNIDSMQGTGAVWAGTTRKELHKALWDDWYGTYDDVTGTHRTKFTSYFFTNVDTDNKQFAYTAYYNLSATCGYNNGADEECDDEDAQENAPNPSYLSAMPLTENLATIQASMNRAIFQASLGIGLEFDTKTFPKKLNKCDYDFFGCLSINDFIAIAFLPWIFVSLSFVIIIIVVFEKATHLRDIMVMSGLKMQTYWVVMWAFYFSQYMVMMFVLWLVSAFVGLRTFIIHSPIVMLLFFVIWGNCMVVFSFFISTFFRSVRTAVCITLLFQLIAIQGGVVMIIQLLTNPAVGYDESPYLAYMWFPPMAMLRCLMWLVYGAAFNVPCTMDNIATYGFGSILRSFLYMIGETIIMIPLIFYFESILGEAPRHPCFPCFDLHRWWKSKRQVDRDDSLNAIGVTVDRPIEEEPEDIAAERDRVERGGPEQAVRVQHFRKVFPSSKRGIPDKVAVQDLTFSVNKNECFGLLGHNGAGKTTTISMLCGLFKPTSGNATILNLDLLQDPGKIHERMGVCPQHDILWNDLTAAEHLRFYGRLRKIPEESLTASVNKALDAVNLLEWANVLSSKFSGGMKRRLSTACSLMGDPEVVYMDEPSTGLDPASRHRLWDVIAKSKGKNSILLTTHSMEEADLLCDRIGIMGDGKMMCLGTAPDLKRRFGTGYKLSINLFSTSNAAASVAEGFVNTILPSAVLLNVPLGGILDFEIPREEVRLSSVYAAVENERDRLGIIDWALSETTLEEVFLKVTSHSDEFKRPLNPSDDV